MERAGRQGRLRTRRRAQLRRCQLLHRRRRIPDHTRDRRAGGDRPRHRRHRRRGLLDGPHRSGQRPAGAARRCRRVGRDPERRRRGRRGDRDHDHRHRQQAGPRRGRGLEHRRDGQGRGHARAGTGHDAGRAHHRRRPRRRRAGSFVAGGDRGELRPARLRRLSEHQRHRHPARQRRLRRATDGGRLHRGAHAGLSRPGTATPRGRRGRGPRDRDHRHGRRVRDRCPRGGTQHRAQQPLQGRRLREGPQLGPGAGQHRHHGGRLRPGRSRRRDERRLGVPHLHARRGPRPGRPRAPAGHGHCGPQVRSPRSDDLDQRSDPRVRPREQRVQLVRPPCEETSAARPGARCAERAMEHSS